MQNFLQEASHAVITYGPWVVTAASAAAAALPSAKPGSVWAQVRTVIDFLAINFGSAKNAK